MKTASLFQVRVENGCSFYTQTYVFACKMGSHVRFCFTTTKRCWNGPKVRFWDVFEVNNISTSQWFRNLWVSEAHQARMLLLVGATFYLLSRVFSALANHKICELKSVWALKYAFSIHRRCWGQPDLLPCLAMPRMLQFISQLTSGYRLCDIRFNSLFNFTLSNQTAQKEPSSKPKMQLSKQ